MYTLKNVEIGELLCMIKTGDDSDAAFSEIIRRYMPLIHSKVNTYSESLNESESMQEASIALHSAAVTYDPEKCNGVTFGLYANVCISNRLKSLYRKVQRESMRNDSFAEPDEAVSDSDVESFIVTRDLCDRVMSTAKVILSEYEYEVFHLSFMQYATKDIAKKLGRTPKSIDNAKRRISERLRANREIREILFDL